MAKYLFPFLLGIFLIAFQPLFDTACSGTLQKNAYDKRARDAAEWAAAASAFFPAAALTAYGSILVIYDLGHGTGDWILIVAVALMVCSFLLFLHEVSSGTPARAPLVGGKKWHYTRLQVWLALLNGAGIALVVWYHFHGDQVK